MRVVLFSCKIQHDGKSKGLGSNPSGTTLMSLDKSILYGKEHRSPYRRAKAVSCSCRNHGSCPWCLDNRTFNKRKTEIYSLMELRDFTRGEGYTGADELSTI